MSVRAVVYSVLVAAVVGGGGFLYGQWQHAEVRAVEADLAAASYQRDRWETAATDWQRQVRVLEEERDAAREAQRALRAELSRKREDYEQIRRNIEASTAEDDGPVAPVLRETLEALP